MDNRMRREQHIELRTTLVKHLCTDGMVEAMNKKIKANMVKLFHYHSIDRGAERAFARLPHQHNFNLKLRVIGRLPPFEALVQWYNNFSIKPDHFIVEFKR